MNFIYVECDKLDLILMTKGMRLFDYSAILRLRVKCPF